MRLDHPAWGKIVAWLRGVQASLDARLAAFVRKPGAVAEPARTPAAKARKAPPPLVKSRPASLEQRYSLLNHDELADEIFRRLQRNIFDAIDAQAKKPVPRGQIAEAVFREAGRLAPNRPYFYVKPQGRQGWLFERSGAGWVITPAEKIVARDLFLREQEPIDAASLYMARDRAVFPRVKSAATGDALLAFAVYEQRLMQQLGLS